MRLIVVFLLLITATPGTGKHRQLITLQLAAERLQTSQLTVRRLISSGELHGYRIGKRMLRVDAAEVDRLGEQIPTGGAA